MRMSVHTTREHIYTKTLMYVHSCTDLFTWTERHYRDLDDHTRNNVRVRAHILVLMCTNIYMHIHKQTVTYRTTAMDSPRRSDSNSGHAQDRRGSPEVVIDNSLLSACACIHVCVAVCISFKSEIKGLS
jgi:hypothetical protein